MSSLINKISSYLETFILLGTEKVNSVDLFVCVLKVVSMVFHV